MRQAEDKQDKLLNELFGFYVRGQIDRFLEGCTKDMSLTVRGSSPKPTIVSSSDLARWHASMMDLSNFTLRSKVCLTLSEGDEHIVMLHHAVERDGINHQFETINRCTFRGKLISAWFSYPSSLVDYVSAWGLQVAEQKISSRVG